MAKKVVYREYTVKIETRAATDDAGKRVLYGLIPFRSQSLNLGGFVEMIAPSAFDHTLNDGADVKCLIDHDRSKILGRVKNGTLKLEKQDDGLHFEVELNNTSYANDLYENVKTGNITSMSFGFITLIDDWSYDSNPPTRILKDVKLLEVSFVVFPAYPESTAQARGLTLDGAAFDEVEDIIIRSKNPAYEITDADKATIEKTMTALRSISERSVNKNQEPDKTRAIPETYYENLKKQIPVR